MYLKYTAKDAEWKKIVSHFETLRLFGRLALRKGKKGERLSAGELDVLFRIALGITPQTPGMLSADMGASKTIVSRFTDSLCKKELIQKRQIIFFSYVSSIMKFFLRTTIFFL